MNFQKNINYQNLAICRFFYMWAALFLFNVVSFSPAISLGIVVIMEAYSQFLGTKSKIFKERNSKNFINKHNTILFTDLLIFLIVLLKSQKLYLKENVLFFILYNLLLLLYNTNIYEMYTKHLLNNDTTYFNETYIKYSKRIWNIDVIQSFIITGIFLYIIRFSLS